MIIFVNNRIYLLNNVEQQCTRTCRKGTEIPVRNPTSQRTHLESARASDTGC